MKIWFRELGDFATNCYLVACTETKKAMVVDPGTPDPWIKKSVAQYDLKVELILLTHGHLDHIGGVEWVKSWSGAPVWIHEADSKYLTSPALNGSAFFGQPIVAPRADRLLRGGEQISVGSLSFQVLHTPGHTPGGISLYTPGHLIAGDTLFAGSIGRTDLAGGNHGTLIKAIKERLLPLPPETVVYPGHGPTTTIGDEKEYNPFLA
ncbi:MAG: MBL fold metallo-hydrolase [Bacillota bacterium]